MSNINENELTEQEAFERITRKFTSSNSVDVERATILKEEWELAKKFIEQESLKTNGLLSIILLKISYFFKGSKQ
jgi:lipoate-protein ligase A